MRPLFNDLTVGNLTDIGLNPNRTSNQDYYGVFEGMFGSLFIVCDGMGGHAGGEIASHLTVETISNYFKALGSVDKLSVKQKISESIEMAQKKTSEYTAKHPDAQGMGTTLVMLLIKEDNFWYAHVGDSRLYLRRNGTIQQLTKDHSEVQGMVDVGILTEEQAKEHPRKNVITRAIGSKTYHPDISGPNLLFIGDQFLLCSDGLSGYFDKDELANHMKKAPQHACDDLVEIAKERGGSDNITIQIIRANTGKRPEGILWLKKPINRMKIAAFMLLGILIISGVFWNISRNNDADKIEVSEEHNLKSEDFWEAWVKYFAQKDSTLVADLNQALKEYEYDELNTYIIPKRNDYKIVWIAPENSVLLDYESIVELGFTEDEKKILLLLVYTISQDTSVTDSWIKKYESSDFRIIEHYIFDNFKEINSKIGLVDDSDLVSFKEKYGSRLTCNGSIIQYNLDTSEKTGSTELQQESELGSTLNNEIKNVDHNNKMCVLYV